MAKKERTTEASADQERLRLAQSAHRLAQWTSVIKEALKYGTIAFGMLQIQLAVASMTGQDTKFSAVLDAALKFDASKYGALALAAILGYDNYRQRKLRKGEVRELSATIKRYEFIIDPKRSSSGLSVDGTPARRMLKREEGNQNEP